MPQGIPTLPFQPIYRYSQAGTKPGATLFQLGAGVFSAHITPPYKRWSDFRPFLEKGVTALLEAREGSEKESLFTQSLVRYLDNFSEVHTQAASVRQFLAETLGIQIKLPEALESRVSKGKGITPFVKLTVPLDEGRTMSLSVGNGKIGDKAGIIMDSAVASMKPLQPKIDVVMQFLDDAHRVVSDCFVEITTPIHQAMGVTDE